MSPVIAALDDLKSPTNAATVVAKADQDKGNERGMLACDHHCCNAHTHYGNSPAYSHLPSLSMTSLRLPLLADQFPAAFGPNPLLEPPSHA